MRKQRLALALATLAVLVAAAPAAAKEITKATIWGASGSTTVDDPAQLRLLPTGGEYTTEAPKPAPFYTIDFTLDEGREQHHVFLLYVPSADRLAGNGEFGGLDWFPVLGDETKRLLDGLVADIEPYQPKSGWPPGLKSPDAVSAFADVTVADAEGGSQPGRWAVIAAALAAAALLAVAAVARRRRPRPAARPEAA